MPGDNDREVVLGERERRRILRPGIGLYTYEQIRGTTPFQFASGIVVGAIVAVAGMLLLWGVWKTRLEEISSYGTAASHWGGFVTSIGLIVVGIFMAHAGVIFYWKRFKAHRRNRD